MEGLTDARVPPVSNDTAPEVPDPVPLATLTAPLFPAPETPDASTMEPDEGEFPVEIVMPPEDEDVPALAVRNQTEPDEDPLCAPEEIAREPPEPFLEDPEERTSAPPTPDCAEPTSMETEPAEPPTAAPVPTKA